MRIRTFGGLWIEGPTPSPALGPRRLALLALVAAAGKRGISRDRVVGILWPDAEEDQARHTLSQTIYTLKRDTGRDWIVPGPELRLDAGVTSEVGDLKEALTSGAFERVEALATGVFLDGFYLAGAPEFERWVEEERGRLKASIMRAVEQLAARADGAGSLTDAVRSWTLLTELDPLSSRYAVGRMKALASAGDRASALAHARAYEELVRRELESEVDPGVRRLVAFLRAESAPEMAPSGTGASTDLPAPEGQSPPPQSSRRYHRLIPLVLLPLAVVAALVARPRTTTPAPFLAVGDIRLETSDTTRQGSVLRDMLATNLSGIEGLQVLANSRLVELLFRPGEDTPGSTSDAARRAGAAEVIEGDVTTEAAGLVLTLRRVALSNGVLRKGYVVRAANRYALVDSATAAIARDLGLLAPSTTVAEIRTSSPVAYALYDEGLRAHFGFDDPAAYRLMTAALSHDSTFAMAAYYAWFLARSMSLGDSIHLQALERVKRLALRTSDRERLLIQVSVAGVDAPLRTAAALADSLTVRYPSDPDGQLVAGQVRASQGDYAGAIAASERAFSLDSAAGALRGPYCRACFAINQMAQAYLWWDSAAASARSAQRLLAIRPDDLGSWRLMVEPLLRLGRRAEAQSAADRGGGPRSGTAGLFNRDLIRWGRYEEADRIHMEDAMSLDAPTRSEGWWLLLLSLRDQGRLREADTLIHQMRIPNSTRRLPQPGPKPIDLALLGMEMGRPAASIRAHRENADGVRRSGAPPGLRARFLTWNLALAGTAHAAAGDTAIVRRLADSLETLGGESTWERDGRIHHVLRGMLSQQTGRHDEAVREFRSSIYSLTDGYTRANLLLARSLLMLRRPEEAIAVLRPAIHGGVDGSNTYVSRTELHEALAQAFEMAGQRDSARTHWRAVESAWRRADPAFRDRYETARGKAY